MDIFGWFPRSSVGTHTRMLRVRIPPERLKAALPRRSVGTIKNLWEPHLAATEQADCGLEPNRREARLPHIWLKLMALKKS
jgi:hypothetical protein